MKSEFVYYYVSLVYLTITFFHCVLPHRRRKVIRRTKARKVIKTRRVRATMTMTRRYVNLSFQCGCFSIVADFQSVHLHIYAQGKDDDNKKVCEAYSSHVNETSPPHCHETYLPCFAFLQIQGKDDDDDKKKKVREPNFSVL